jgi:hypothetical protein
LHVHGHGAKAISFGCSFAVLSTQVSGVGLRLRQKCVAQVNARGATQVLDRGV